MVFVMKVLLVWNLIKHSIMVTDYVKNICKIGQGKDCCRYLIFGTGFECAKLTTVSRIIDVHATLPSYTSKGNNCDGLEENQFGQLNSKKEN